MKRRDRALDLRTQTLRPLTPERLRDLRGGVALDPAEVDAPSGVLPSAPTVPTQTF